MLKNLFKKILRNIFFILFDIFLALFFVVLIEISIRISENMGWLHLKLTRKIISVNDCKNYPKKLKIKEIKNKNIFRIFVFGGSSVFGFPYHEISTFPGWIYYYLRGAYPNKNIEVLNCGWPGYTTEDIIPLFNESLNYKPNLVIIYAGHNNYNQKVISRNLYLNSKLITFIRNLHLFKLLDSTIGVSLAERKNSDNKKKLPSDGFNQKIYSALQYHLGYIAKQCKINKIPIIISTVSSNFSGWSPTDFDLSTVCDNTKTAKKYKGFCQGKQYLEKGNYKASLKYLHQFEKEYPFKTNILEISGSLIYFYLGKNYEMLKNYNKAFFYYEQAIEYDNLSLRAPEELNKDIRNLKKKYNNIIISNIDKLFKKKAKNGIPGNEFFIDHLHPNIYGQRLIAKEICNIINRHKIFSKTALEKNIKSDNYYAKKMGINKQTIKKAEQYLCFYFFRFKHLKEALVCYENIPFSQRSYLEDIPIIILNILLNKELIAQTQFKNLVEKYADKYYSKKEVNHSFALLKKNILKGKYFDLWHWPDELNSYYGVDFPDFIEKLTTIEFKKQLSNK